MPKTILLTGATGFLGSHLLEALIKEGHQVVILKRSTSNTWRIDHLLAGVVAFDIDVQPIESAFEAQHIDVVIHTACNYGRNQDPVNSIVDSNLMFALQVLDAATYFEANIFINTDTVLPRDLNTYSLSKYQFVEWLKRSDKKIKCINLKLDHMYGPKDDKKKFITLILSQMINSEEKIKLTKGQQKRDFIYIDDVVSAYMLLLSQIKTLPMWSEFNVGTNSFISIKDFVLTLQSIVEASKEIKLNDRLCFGEAPYRDGEVMVPAMDNTKLVKLGWQPKVKLDEGLRKTVEAFK